METIKKTKSLVEVKQELRKVINAIAVVSKRRTEYIEQVRKGRCSCCDAIYPLCNDEREDLNQFYRDLYELEQCIRDLEKKRIELEEMEMIIKEVTSIILCSEIDQKLSQVIDDIADIHKRKVNFFKQKREGKCGCCEEVYPLCCYEQEEIFWFQKKIRDLETKKNYLSRRKDELTL